MVAALLKGLLLGLMLSVSVGPIIFTIIKQSILHGRKAGYAFVAGISFSDITMVVICNFFTGLFDAALKHEKVIAIAGSIFLLGLGIYTFFFKKVNLTDENKNIKLPEKVFKHHELLALSVSGFFMNMLNPGAILFWFAWSAAIMADSKSTPHPIQYRIIVFGTCLAFLLATDIAKVLLAGRLRSKLTQKNMHRIDQLLGLILIGFGIALFWGVLEFGSKLK